MVGDTQTEHLKKNGLFEKIIPSQEIPHTSNRFLQKCFFTQIANENA